LAATISPLVCGQTLTDTKYENDLADSLGKKAERRKQQRPDA
jgi:hypothetical protein